MTFFSFSIVKAAYDRVRFLFRGKIKKPKKVCMYVLSLLQETFNNSDQNGFGITAFFP